MDKKFAIEFCTEDIISDQSLIKQLTTVAYNWNICAPFKAAYELNSKYDHKSKLEDSRQKINLKVNVIKKVLTSVADIKPTAGMNFIKLSQTFLHKTEHITELIVELRSLNNLISDKFLLQHYLKAIESNKG